MPFPLLSTKLFIPPQRASAISRPHLTEKLRSMVERPGSFALLSGPAGFGKTTLLSEFVAQLGQPVAWLSLDEGDNDPNRFWTYLITACQSVAPGVGEAALDLLRAAPLFPGDIIPTLLINDLSQQDASLVLVLDDFHAVRDAAIHSSLLYLLDHLPGNVHLIIATRTDPPLPLARFRARNQLIEIRTQDLRFNLDEADAFLNRSMGLSLPAQDLTALEERTEGWPAGLQLAALSMQGRQDTSAFIRAFTGSHAYIAEYLVDEVLQRQPEEMQSFLLKTAILEHLTAYLCDAVTGSRDGQTRLRMLQQANIFIVPLDDEARWFRYHHLFADLLKARLRSTFAKAEIDALHQRAAEWYEHNAMPAEAIEHWITARDYPRAIALVEKIALATIMQASIRTVERWLQAIPSVYYEHNAGINMAYAWMNLIRGTPLQATTYIERLQRIFAGSDASQLDPSLQAEWLVIQAELLIAQGRPQESRDLARKAQAILPSLEPNVRSMIYVTLAKAYQLTLDYDRAAEIFQMIVQDARLAGDITFEVLGISGEAQMTLKQGRLRRTFEIVREGIDRLERSGKKVPFGATLYGELGQVFFAWGKFDQARAYFQRSKDLSGKSGYSDPEIYFHLMLSKVCQMQGDQDGSVQEMEQASQLASLTPPAMIRESILSQQVMIDLAAGHPAAAEQRLVVEGFRFADAFRFPDLPPESAVTLEMGLVYNSALRVLLYHARHQTGPGQLEAGIELAGRLLEAELKSQHLPAALETLLLRSQLHAAAGNQPQSLADAARALELAEPEGFVSPFVQEGQPVANILAELAKGALPGLARPETTRAILAAFPMASSEDRATGAMKDAASTGGAAALVEPLTAREMEVLKHIAAGDSNAAIAETLVISVSAVKKHTSNIYGKLGVNSRTQAVSRARQLGLLSPEE